MDSITKKRIVMCVTGVVLSGVAVSFFKSAVFGVDPFQALMSGLDALIPIKYGTLYVIVNAVLLLFSLVFDRTRIGLGTLINLFLLGYIVQFGVDILAGLIPAPSLFIRIIYLLVGVLIACLAASLYFTANMGVSTYDAIALIITDTWKIGRFKFVRIITDFTCVILGVILFLISGQEVSGLYAVVGIGTIISAFMMGPMIDYFNVHLFGPMLNGK
jgi:uncharacterized membrane protein YczE